MGRSQKPKRLRRKLKKKESWRLSLQPTSRKQNAKIMQGATKRDWLDFAAQILTEQSSDVAAVQLLQKKLKKTPRKALTMERPSSLSPCFQGLWSWESCASASNPSS